LTASPGAIINQVSPNLFGSVSPSGDEIYDASFTSTKCTADYQGSLTRQ
jgi:hypothetical protein